MKRMVRAFGFFCVLSQLVFATRMCTLAKGAYDRTDGALKGCQYSYSIEFCPRHHNLHEKEHLNSITFEVRSNMTKVGFVSTCAVANKVFASVVRDDFKSAVTATRIQNMTTMEGTFRASLLYSIAEDNQTASPMLFSLHNDHEANAYGPLTVSFVVDRETGGVTFTSAFANTTDVPTIVQLDYPSHHVAVEEKKTIEHAKCDFNTLLSGQWNYDADNKTWRWKTHTCDSELMTVEAFVDWCKKYELKSLLFFGSSRTRTMLFDLLLFFGYTLDEVKPDKLHQHFTYHVQDKLHYDPTLHLLWDDNRIDSWGQGFHSYTNVMTDMKLHFAEMNICTHDSSVYFNPEDGFHRPSNVDYTTQESRRYAAASQPYAVIFTIGVYEAMLTGVDSFKALAPDLVKFVYESCMGIIPNVTNSKRQSDRNMFFVRTEEAVDPSIEMFDALNQVNDFMSRTIVPRLNGQLYARNMPAIMLLDSHHVSRGWKLFKTDRDDVHYYNPEPGTFYGNHVSLTMGRIVLQQVAQKMEERLRGARNTSTTDIRDRTPYVAPHTHTFPAFSALPEYHYDTIVPLEGKLLMSPHNHEEMFLVHGGVKRSIVNWATFLALQMDIRAMVNLEVVDFDSIPTGPPLPSV